MRRDNIANQGDALVCGMYQNRGECGARMSQTDKIKGCLACKAQEK